MSRTLAALLLACLGPLARAQAGLAPDTAAHRTIAGAFDLFTTDDLGHLYALKGDVLLLFDAQGRQLARNSLNTFGPITRVDAFSSLKPLIFSRQQGQLALLDNTLSVQASAIDLPRNGYAQVTQVCMSVQNSFWFFDERELALIRVDAQLRPLARTGRLDQLLGFTPHPTYLVELDGWLYVCDPEHGVLLFDLFGAYTKTLPVKGAERIEVRDGQLWYVLDGRLMAYGMRSFATEEVPWPAPADGPVLDARIERGHLYRLMPDRIVIDALR